MPGDAGGRMAHFLYPVSSRFWGYKRHRLGITGRSRPFSTKAARVKLAATNEEWSYGTLHSGFATDFCYPEITFAPCGCGDALQQFEAMGVTQIDLYRSGNATSARLPRVRINVADSDVETYTHSSGDEWVRANTGGVSTWDAPDPSWRGPAWRLPVSSRYPDELIVKNDDPGHWVWEPSRDMPLADYLTALETVDGLFRKV